MNRSCRKAVQFNDRKPRSITPSKKVWIPPPGNSSKIRCASVGRHRKVYFEDPLSITDDNVVIPCMSKRDFLREKLTLVFSALKHFYEKDSDIDICYLQQLIELEPKIIFVIDELITDINDAESKKCHLSSLLSETRKEINETREILNSNLVCKDCELGKEINSNLKGALNRKESELEGLIIKLKDLQAKCDQHKRDSEEINQALHKKSDENIKLKHLAKEYKSRFLKLTSETKGLQENLTECKLKYANLKHQFDELLYEKQRNDANANKLDRIQQDLRDLRYKPSSENNNSADNTSLVRMSQELEDVKKERNSYKDEIEKLRKEIEEIIKEKNKLKEIISEKERLLNESKREMSSLKSNYDNLKDDYKELRNKPNQPTLDPYTRQELMQTRQSSNKDNLCEQKRIHELEMMTKSLENEIHRLQMQNEEASKSASNRIFELKQQLIKADASNRSLHSYLNFLKRSYSSVFQANCNSNCQIFDLQGANKSCLKLSTAKLGFD